MAEGKYYDESGDFDEARDFDSLDRYREEDQAYLRAHSQTLLNGKPLEEDNKNTAGFGKFGRRRDEDGNSRWGLLRKGEKDASEKPNRNGKGGDKKASLGEKENNVESDDNSMGGKFKNAVKGVKDLKSGKVGKAKGRFKKAGPLIVILASFLTFGGGAFLGQMAMPFSLVSQFQEEFDSIRTSQNIRSKNMLRWQTAKNKTVKDCIKAHYFKSDEFKVSKRQKNKLAKTGITFEEEDGITVMKHHKSNGEIQTIVADPADAGNGRMSFESAFDNDTEFRTNYSEGSRTWRGSVGAWFDSSMDKLLKKLGVKRGVWREFKSGKSKSEGMDDMRKTIKGESDVDGVDSKSNSLEPKKETKDDGHGGKETTRTIATETEDTGGISRADVKTDANGKVTNTDGLKSKLKGIASKFGKISSAAQAAVGIYCGVADFVGAVSAIVAAYQTMQVISLTANFFEGIQKAQAGDGSSSPVNELANALTMKSATTYTEVKTVKKTGDKTAEADKVDTITRTNSAMGSNGIGATYGRTAVDPTDPSVRSFNINSFNKNLFSGLASILNNIKTTASAYRSCTTAKFGAAVVGAVGDIATVAACVATVGIGCVVDFFVNQGAKTAFSALFSLAVSTIVSFMVPFVANILTRKIATEVVGEDLGNALVSGANEYMGRNMQYSGGSLGGEKALTGYILERDRVVAEEARYQRETRSPFDITSQYTFMGSIARQMTPLISSSSSLMGIVNGVSTVVGSAVSTISPHSSAVSAGIEAQIATDNTKEYCPDIADIGAVADAFCNPYIITDTRTLNDHPADVVNSIDDKNLTVDGDGNPVVVENSDLAKYIVYCGQRSSPFGLADQNIASEVDTAGNVGGTVGSSIIGATPIVGDLFDIKSGSDKLMNFGWISGEACVIDNDSGGLFKSTPSWKETKKYQRFIEDQRLAEAEGIIEKSAVTDYLAKYYEKHPIDTSFEGTLARYSGLTKDNVIATLDTLETLQWIAEYDPSEYAPYRKSFEPLDEDKIDFQIEQQSSIASVFDVITNSDYGCIDNRRNTYNYTA